MPPDIDITKTKRFKHLIIFLLIGIMILGWLFFKINNVFGAMPFQDNFENYELGQLSGQGGWYDSTTYQVVDEISHSGEKAIKTTSWGVSIQKEGVPTSSGQWNFWWQAKDSINLVGSFYLTTFVYGGYYGCGAVRMVDGELKIWDIQYPYFQTFDTFVLDEWFEISIEWSGETYRAKKNNNEWSNWYNWGGGFPECSELGIYGTLLNIAGIGYFYLDDIGIEAFPPEMRIWGISPESGIEVSNLDLEITIGYEGFDWDEYDGFTIAFWDERLHASSKVKVFVEEDLEEDGSGEIVVNLTDFGLDKKGRWHLTGLGFGTHLDIQSGMFLTTLGYVDFWTGELVDPEYYFIVVAEELPDLYPISDFEIWYGDNVVEFEAPTDFALAIAGFFQPILEKIGEFHARTQIFLDTNEAYARGKSMGDVFPIITGWVAQISYFMGGFPLVSWFKYLLIMLFAIFIIKAVLKFIPFLGK